MKTVLPARARPVTPKRRLGVERPDAKSFSPPAAMRALSMREERFNSPMRHGPGPPIVGALAGPAQGLTWRLLGDVAGADEHRKRAFPVLDGVPVIGFEGDHGQGPGRILLGEALAQFRIALADETLRQALDRRIVSDDHDR